MDGKVMWKTIRAPTFDKGSMMLPMHYPKVMDPPSGGIRKHRQIT